METSFSITSTTKRSTDGQIYQPPLFSNLNPLYIEYSDYCYLNDYVNAGKENNCHEFMGYIFIKAIQDLNERLGPDMVNKYNT